MEDQQQVPNMEAILRKLLAEQQANMEALVRQQVGAQSNLARGLPEDKLRELWAKWDREHLRPANGRQSLRHDVETCVSYQGLILDLAFEYEGLHRCSGIGWNPRKKNPAGGYIEDTVCHAEGPHVHLGEFKVNELNKQIGAAWFDRLAITPREHNRAGGTDYRANGSLNRILSTLQGCLKKMVGKVNNPLHGVPTAEVDKEVREGCFFENEEQFEDFLRYCNPTLRDMCYLAAWSGGMRAKEVRLLRIEWVNWEKKEIELPESQKGGKRHTKSGKGRKIPLMHAGINDGKPHVYEMLVKRREESERMGTPYLFPNPNPKWKNKRPETIGGPVPADTLTGWMRSAGERWGVLLGGKFRPIFHGNRHTWGTWGGIKGMPLKAMMKQAGWSNPSMAMRYMQYAKDMMADTTRLQARSVKQALSERRREQKEEDE